MYDDQKINSLPTLPRQEGTGSLENKILSGGGEMEFMMFGLMPFENSNDSFRDMFRTLDRMERGFFGQQRQQRLPVPYRYPG